MRAFYSADTVADNFQAVRLYDDIDGREVLLIIGHDQAPVLTAIDAHESTANKVTGHEILAILEMKKHNVGGETRYSERGFWQAEGLNFEPLHELMRANLAARCNIVLLTGAELAEVERAEALRLEAEIDEMINQHRTAFLKDAAHDLEGDTDVA